MVHWYCILAPKSVNGHHLDNHERVYHWTLLSLVFILNHNGKEVYNTSKDFVNAQVASTRNIEANMFNDWFTRWSQQTNRAPLVSNHAKTQLEQISSHVRALCEKHGLVYEDLNITLGTYRVVEALAEVAAAATTTVASS
ncbi:unnamed protein product [Sphagnum tenellum]